jgi:membrane protein involved in colicin uptake
MTDNKTPEQLEAEAKAKTEAKAKAEAAKLKAIMDKKHKAEVEILKVAPEDRATKARLAREIARADAQILTAAEKSEKPYVVTELKSVTSRKGVLAAGTRCNAGYFSGGEEAVKRLVEAKVLIKA